MLLLVQRCRRWPQPASYCKRYSSSDAAFPLLSWFSNFPPATFVEQGLLQVHGAGNCWSLEIVACTAVARLLVSTFTMTYTRRVFTNYALTMHPLNTKMQQVKKQRVEEQTFGTVPPLMARDIRVKELRQLREQKQRLTVHHNIHPGKAFVTIGLEAVFWLSYAAAVRNIVAGFPAEWTQVAQQDMQSQGALWFPDLSLPDPYHILPAITALTLLFSVNMMAQWRFQNNVPEIRLLKLIRYAAFPLSGWMYYCLSAAPTALSLLMATSFLVSASQAYAFTHPSVQRLLRIPHFAGQTLNAVSFNRWMVDIGVKRLHPRQNM